MYEMTEKCKHCWRNFDDNSNIHLNFCNFDEILAMFLQKKRNFMRGDFISHMYTGMDSTRQLNN